MSESYSASVLHSNSSPQSLNSLSLEEYTKMYKESISNPTTFWATQANNFITWDSPFQTVLEGSFKEGKVKWFKEGSLNACYNCIDRHAKQNPNKIAIVYEADSEKDSYSLTYIQLLEKVCQLANYFKSIGLNKGDVVALYLPPIPEAAVSMLACARLGLIHNVVFSGFSSNALRERINHSSARVLITTNESIRGGKILKTKQLVDEAINKCPSIERVLVVKRTMNEEVNMQSGRDLWFGEETRKMETSCGYEKMNSESPLFILYTSGSTGKPKGIVHTTAGYLLGTAITTRYIFDTRTTDVFGCTADIGWITGHSYSVYGPLMLGLSTLLFEGLPTYPKPNRYWATVEKYSLTQLYTSPTAIRALKQYGDEYVNKHNLQSLRVLGTVGEPIDPESWMWFYKTVGRERCELVDTYWQTETGSILISNIPYIIKPKPGSAAKPFFGIDPEIKKDSTNSETKEGPLVIKKPWPSMCRTIFKNPERYMKAYFDTYEDCYFTGDGSLCDEDQYYWIKGRLDDVINVSGHRLSTAEIEAAINMLDDVTESAVIGAPDQVSGECIYAYAVLRAKKDGSIIEQDIRQTIRSSIGPIATPKYIKLVKGLPKTRSGKIMRRILKKIAAGDKENLGDLSTLANPEVIGYLCESQKL